MTNKTESWHDLEESISELNEVYNKIPPPPVPDDGFSQKKNQLFRAVEGMTQLLQTRCQMEDEA